MKRILFYILSFTGGIIMSLIGLIIMVIPFGKYHIFHGRLYKTVGKDGGGLNLGCFFICGRSCQYDGLMGHECGHGLQNIIGGPLFPFVIAIPSAIRYWYREYRSKKGLQNKPYDAIWFEGQATNGGHKYIVQGEG